MYYGTETVLLITSQWRHMRSQADMTSYFQDGGSGGDLSWLLGVQAWGHLSPSVPTSILLFPFLLVDSPPAAKYCDAIYAVKQLYKIHIDV